MLRKCRITTFLFFFFHVIFTSSCDPFLNDFKPFNIKDVCSAASYHSISPEANCCINSDDNEESLQKSSTICKKLYLMQKQHVQSTFSYNVKPIIRFSDFKYNKVEEQLEVPGIFSEIWQNTLKKSCKIYSNENGDFVRLHLIIGALLSDALKVTKEAKGNSKSRKYTSKFLGIKWGKNWLDVTKNYKNNNKKEQECVELLNKKRLFRMFQKPKQVNDILAFLTRVYDIPLAKFSSDTNDKTFIFPLFKEFSNEGNLKYFSLIEFLKKPGSFPFIKFNKSFIQGCALASCEKTNGENSKNFDDLQKRISENFMKIKSYSEKLSTTKDAKQIKKKDLFLSHIVNTFETRLNKKMKNGEQSHDFIEPTSSEMSEICKEATMPLLDFFKKKYQNEKIQNVISYIEDIKTIVPDETVSDEKNNYLQTMLKDVVILKEHPFLN